MTRFIDEHRDRETAGLRWGVEPICAELTKHACGIAPSTYYAAKTRLPSPRASIGSVGDSFDNAMAESVIGLHKTECVRHEGPWRGVDDLELATLNWVWWFNQIRLHGEIGHVPPIEFENDYYRSINSQPQPQLGEPSLH